MMVTHVTRTRVLRFVYFIDPKRQDRYSSQRDGRIADASSQTPIRLLLLHLSIFYSGRLIGVLFAKATLT